MINKKTIKICFVLFENLTNFPQSLASLKNLRSHEDGKFMFPQLLFNIWFDPLFLNSKQKKAICTMQNAKNNHLILNQKLHHVNIKLVKTVLHLQSSPFKADSVGTSSYCPL